MDLSVIGLGLVSPAGLTPREHVFFLRAEANVATARAFVRQDGELVDCVHCPWLDPRLPLPDRLSVLAGRALGTALGPVAAMMPGVRLPLVLVHARPWEALGDADAQAVEAALVARYPVECRARALGETGMFEGLVHAARWLGAPSTPDAAAPAAVAIVAVDSFVSGEVLGRRLEEPDPWSRSPADLSEAAAAIVVTRRGAERVPLLGRIVHAGVEQGPGRDEDEEIVDGQAMTKHLRALGGYGRITHSFGQGGVDSLRATEWRYATSRNHGLVDPSCVELCLEDEIGRVGAAAGGANLVFALGSALHGALEDAPPAPRPGALVSWAVSRDGVRGLAVAKGAP